jgi:hypothetical protein
VLHGGAGGRDSSWWCHLRRRNPRVGPSSRWLGPGRRQAAGSDLGQSAARSDQGVDLTP